MSHLNQTCSQCLQHTFLTSLQAFEAVWLTYSFFRNSALHHWLFVVQCFEITWWSHLQGMDIQFFIVHPTLTIKATT